MGVYNLMWQMGVCGQELFGCKCRIVGWKYVTVCVGRL